MEDKEKRKFGRATISFAYLAQASRGNEGDQISGIGSIFKPIAMEKAGQRFDSKEFCELVDQIYGLRVHQWAAEDICDRLVSAGILEKEQVAEGVTEYKYAQITSEFDEVSEADVKELVDRFVEFATPVLALHSVSADYEALEDALFEQLVDMNFLSILLKPDRTKEDQRGESTLTLKKNTNPDQEKWIEETEAKAKLEVLCASFILEVYRKHPKLYELLCRIAAGALVSEVVLNFRNPGVDQSLERMTIILDTPFLMAYMDLTSREQGKLAQQICDTLLEKGAHLGVFKHSVQELKDNLSAVLGEYEAGRAWGATANRLPDRTFHAFAESIKNNPLAMLKNKRISVIRSDPREDEYRYFTEDQENRFCESLGFYSHLARERDARSIAAIMRLRQGRTLTMNDFKLSPYLFLTENSGVSNKAFSYVLRNNLCEEADVPPAVSDRYISGLLWVMYGGEGRDLPKQLLLANCATALEPRSDVIKQMHRSLSNIDESQAHYFEQLMGEERAGQYLMQYTLGDSALLKNTNVPDLLATVSNSLIEKHQIETERRIDELKIEHAVDKDQAVDVMEAQITAIQEESVRSVKSLQEQLKDSELEKIRTAKELGGIRQEFDNLQSQLTAELSRQRSEDIRNITRCIRSAKKDEKRIERLMIGLITVIILFLQFIALYPTARSPMVVYLLAIATTFVSFLTMWKIPDKIFGTLAERYKLYRFEKYIRDENLEGKISSYEVSWSSDKVLLKDAPTVDQG